MAKRNTPSINAKEAAAVGFRAPPPGEKYLSPNEAARILNISGEAVKVWIYSQRLPAIKMPNGYYRIKLADLERHVTERNSPQMSIMILDGDTAATAMLASGLEKLGYQVSVAHSASVATVRAYARPPSLFLFNASHPGSWQLTKNIRTRTNHKRSPMKRRPVMLYGTDELTEKESLEASNLNVSAFIHRPTPKSIHAEITALRTPSA
jgi:excisionase family DNA binding protein